MKKYIDERSKTPLFDPYEIIKNVPAREWGPSKLIESQEDVYPEFSISRINMPVRASNSGDGPGTDMIKAPFQYWGNKKLGEYNIELAKKTIEDFEKQSHDQDTIESDPNYSIYRDALNYIEHVEGLKKYLNLPYDVNVIRESKYKPTRLQNTNQKTYVFAESTKPGYWNDVVNDMVTESYDNHQYQDPTLNTFTAYRDFDEKGDFVSIYDEWDYNPAVMGGHKMLNKLIDSATGGKSFVVYDRVYLDDYYDIPEEARGNPFITPAVVTAYKKGGRIHIKKKNRGKFTAAAKRAGMGVQEFARHVLANKDKYSSTLVKRANFARNSKKFKHENGGILKYQNLATTLDLPEGSVYGGELEPAVVKPKPYIGELNTYYPVISEYPFTGHSELILYNNDGIYAGHVTKHGTDHDYNLVTNNCSDATRCAVEQVFGKKINPILFTTPGDVQDFVVEQTGSKPHLSDRGRTSVTFEIPFATAMDLKNQNIDLRIQNYLKNAELDKKRIRKEAESNGSTWDSSDYDEATRQVIGALENKKYKFQPFKSRSGGILKALDYANYIIKKPAY